MVEAVSLEAVGVAIALLSPVYGLLWSIQRRIAHLSADHAHVEERLTRIEDRVNDYHNR